jgi:hypothetical protein
MQTEKIKRNGLGAILVSIGFILSPLTWWNDALINLPIAFAFAYLIGMFVSTLLPVNLYFFLTLMATGYFLSNLAGFILMHKGALKFLQKGKRRPFSWKKNLLYSFLALLLVLLSIQTGLLDLKETESFMASVLKVSYLSN